MARIVERCVSRWRRGRGAPWNLWTLHETSRTYHVTYWAWLAIAAGSIIAFGQLAGRAVDPFALAGSCFAGALIGLSRVFVAADDNTALTPVNGAWVALSVTGHPVEAAGLMASFALAQHYRRPLPRHLAVFNVASCVNATMAVAICLLAARLNERPVGSRGWVLTAGVASVVGYATLYGAIAAASCLQLRIPAIRVFWGLVRSSQLVTLIEITVGVMAASMISIAGANVVFAGVAPLIAYALYRSREEAIRAERDATTDQLTGIGNRRALEERLSGSSERDASGWLLVCDLDDFKRLNDSRGHDAGDRALIETARVIGRSIRGTDMCARYGGEEFVVVIEDAEQGVVANIAERIRSSIERDLATMSITVSIGIARMTAGTECSTAFAAADAALYASKRAGKNRVTFADAAASIDAAA